MSELSIIDRVSKIGGIRIVERPDLRVDCARDVLLITNSCKVEVAQGAEAQLVIVASKDAVSKVSISIGRGASVNSIELHENGSRIEVEVQQAGDSIFNAFSLNISDGDTSIKVELLGACAQCNVNALQLLSENEKSDISLNVRHLVPDCQSQTTSKVLVKDSAQAHLQAMVYVAQDAQRTVANQSSRSIELSSGARALIRPELEIYADDVKCSHGATVGQMDDDAILYMRQRGLSEDSARKMMVKGFVEDMLSSVSIPAVNEVVSELVSSKFNAL